MNDDLVARFEDGTFPAEEFHHEQHVYVAWSYLRTMPMSAALDRFCVNLKRFANAAGVPGLYHETITWAFIILTRERMLRGGDEAWDAFKERNPDLFTWKPSILDRYYSAELLWSDRARATFVFPDLGSELPNCVSSTPSGA